MPVDLTGKRALVTGAAQGLGRAIAVELLACGAAVMVADINENQARETAAAIGAEAVRCDVSLAGDCAAAVEAVISHFGGLDILVNNAGVECVGPLATLEEQDFERIFAVNVRGGFLCTQHAIPALTASRGAIVNIASAAGLRGYPLMGAYSASKSAVIRLTETLALELRDAGVRANAICPGSSETAMMTHIAGEYERLVGLTMQPHLDRTQGGRLVKPAEVAKLAAFLASDEASAITGTTNVIDLGASIGSV